MRRRGRVPELRRPPARSPFGGPARRRAGRVRPDRETVSREGSSTKLDECSTNRAAAGSGFVVGAAGAERTGGGGRRGRCGRPFSRPPLPGPPLRPKGSRPRSGAAERQSPGPVRGGCRRDTIRPHRKPPRSPAPAARAVTSPAAAGRCRRVPRRRRARSGPARGGPRQRPAAPVPGAAARPRVAASGLAGGCRARARRCGVPGRLRARRGHHPGRRAGSRPFAGPPAGGAPDVPARGLPAPERLAPDPGGVRSAVASFPQRRRPPGAPRPLRVPRPGAEGARREPRLIPAGTAPLLLHPSAPGPSPPHRLDPASHPVPIRFPAAP